MKYSLNWLKEFVDIRISEQELADKLSLSGLEVESLTPLCRNAKGIVTGKLVKIEKHPNADKLKITQFFDGATTHQIVTGATNVVEGAIVPASLPGAILDNGTAIKASELRGIPSNGMLCSKEELGLSTDESGIWILPDSTPLGVDVIAYFQLQDWTLDIGILPNRGDCQSIYGLAREISTILNTPLKKTFSSPKIESKISSKLEIHIQTPEICPLYSIRKVSGLQNQSSPFWMQQRLERCGIRPISLLVDITNYVMLELGQPLHAFDAKKIAGKPLIIRKSKESETLTSLDKTVLNLHNDTLIIATDETPVAIAGIIGGLDSGVEETTTEIILETAIFDPISIRKTKSTLQLATESASRFEKGVNPAMTLTAANRAAELYQELASGKVEETACTITTDHPIFAKKSIPFSTEKINTLLGSQWTQDEMLAILEKLGFEYNKNEKTIIVPTFRPDISEWPCLAEEIARIKGYDAIANELPTTLCPVEPASPEVILSTQIETQLIGLGFQQLNTLPMIGISDLEKLSLETSTLFTLQNPLSPDQTSMRPSLLPSLIKSLKHNLRHSCATSNFFEIGKIFSPQFENKEEMRCGILVYLGQNPAPYTAEEKTINGVEFAELKGIASIILERLRCVKISFQKGQHRMFHPNQQLDIFSLKTNLGKIGFIHPKLLKDMDIPISVGYIELSIDALVSAPSTKPKYKALAKFPSSKRDIAILAPAELTYHDILNVLEKNKSKWVKDITLIDLYADPKLGENKKSLCVSVKYQDPENTLTDETISAAHTSLCDALTQTLPVTLR